MQFMILHQIHLVMYIQIFIIQPRYINLQNFLLKPDDIRNNIDHQVKYNSYELDYYRNIELNDPYFKLIVNYLIIII
eukprot:UN06505